MSVSVIPTHPTQKIERNFRAALDAGAIWNTADAVEYHGRHVSIGGDELLNFGGCSYLGLEQRPELKEAAIAAIQRYGTQFSFSRAYLESPLYRNLEQLLQRITGGFPLVSASTSLGHISALPVLVQPNDAVIVDIAAHASVQTAARLIRGVELTRVRHNDLDELTRHIEELSYGHTRVWYLLDGLYSMMGDFAPMADIAALLERFPKLHLYVDDAHATSWCGRHGQGYALSQLSERNRVVVALSLNKAFSAAGGVLVLPDEATRARVRMCGGPMVFSGPIQPPMLGAAVASAELHLDPSFASLQHELLQRIDHVLALGAHWGIPFAATERSPIFFMCCGSPERAFALSQRLWERGIYVCVSTFPAVAERDAGIRFTVSLHNSEDDIATLMRAFIEELPLAA